MLILSRPSKFRFHFESIHVSVEVDRLAWVSKTDLPTSATSIELDDRELLSVLDEDYSDEALIGDLEMRSHDLRNMVSSITMVFHLLARQHSEGGALSRRLIEKWLLQLHELNDMVHRSQGNSDRFNRLHGEPCRKGLVLGIKSGHLYQSYSKEGSSMVLVADDDSRKVLEELDWIADFVVGSLPES